MVASESHQEKGLVGGELYAFYISALFPNHYTLPDKPAMV